MTRINVVAPRRLIDQHLIAEYRELPRVRAGIAWQLRSDRPRRRPNSRYRLGPGHVVFFYERLGWCARRHAALIDEMRDRKFTVNLPALMPPPPSLVDLPFEPTAVDIAVNLHRLVERCRLMRREPRYRGHVVGRDWYG